MKNEQLLEQITQLKIQLVQTALEHKLDLQHTTVIKASQHLDALIVQYHSINKRIPA